jgi:hypothetical protein
VAVAVRVVALGKDLHVLLVGKVNAVEAVAGAERL